MAEVVGGDGLDELLRLEADAKSPFASIRGRAVDALVERTRTAEAEAGKYRAVSEQLATALDGWYDVTGQTDVIARLRAELAHARRALDRLREFVDHPGNWSALDGRRAHLLRVIDSVAASRPSSPATEPVTEPETPDAHCSRCLRPLPHTGWHSTDNGMSWSHSDMNAEVVRLRAAVDAILELHAPVKWMPRSKNAEPHLYCEICQLEDGVIGGPWPCPTVAALAVSPPADSLSLKPNTENNREAHA